MPDLEGRKPHGPHVVSSFLFPTLLIVLHVLLVEHTYLVAEAAPGMVLGDQIDVALLGIIYYLMKPDDIWVLNLFQNSQLLFHAVICVFVLAELFPHKHLAIHLLDGVGYLGVLIYAEKDGGELAGTKFFLYHILVYHLAFASLGATLVLGSFLYNDRDIDDGLPGDRCLQNFLLSGVFLLERHTHIVHTELPLILPLGGCYGWRLLSLLLC